MKTVPEMDGGDVCRQMGMYLMPLNYALKTSYGDKFYVMYILSQLKVSILFILMPLNYINVNTLHSPQNWLHITFSIP